MNPSTSKPVKWADIERECGSFRAGFVATFRKYEGQDTDEVDAYGRVVTVTISSFARHNGIEQSTFHRWVTPPAKKVCNTHTISPPPATSAPQLAQVKQRLGLPANASQIRTLASVMAGQALPATPPTPPPAPVAPRPLTWTVQDVVDLFEYEPTREEWESIRDAVQALLDDPQRWAS